MSVQFLCIFWTLKIFLEHILFKMYSFNSVLYLIVLIELLKQYTNNFAKVIKKKFSKYQRRVQKSKDMKLNLTCLLNILTFQLFRTVVFIIKIKFVFKLYTIFADIIKI